jgi:hypothetical protein
MCERDNRPDKIGARIVSHGRYVAFQMAEVAIARNLFAEILRLIAELRLPPVPSTARKAFAVPSFEPNPREDCVQNDGKNVGMRPQKPLRRPKAVKNRNVVP